MATYSIINVLFLVTPISWATHFAKKANGEHIVSPPVQFTCEFLHSVGIGRSLKRIPRLAVAFLGIIPLEHMFDWLAESMIPYIGAVSPLSLVLVPST